MSMSARKDYLTALEKRLREMVTAAEMERILSAAADVLDDGYQVTEAPGTDAGEDDLLGYYLDALGVAGRSPKTLARYRYVIRRLLADTGVPVRRITIHHIRGWIAKEQARGIADSSLEGDRQVFSAFFGWLQRESLIEHNPTANLGAIRTARKRREAYTEADLERLRRSCRNQRDQALVAFLASTGARVGEVTGLNRGDVDLARLSCVVRGKGNKERRVYLDEVAGMLLQDYLDSRTDGDPALFLGRRGRLLPGGVRYMLKRLAARAGVENVHPHRFRRTLATSLTRHGMPIQEVANLLGHDKIDTTMKYVVMDDEGIRSSYRRYA